MKNILDSFYLLVSPSCFQKFSTARIWHLRFVKNVRILKIFNVSLRWSSKVGPWLNSRLLNLEWKSTELNRPTTSFELDYCNWARSTESLEINGLRKVILLEFVKVRGVLIGSNRSLRENDATCNCGPAAFCKGSVENQVARCDHARLSISILSQVTENSAIEFVVLRSETVFTAVLASVSLNYRSTWVCAKLVSVVFQLQLISLPLNQNIETTTQMCFVYFSWVMQLGDLWFCVTRREFNSVRYFFFASSY